MAQYLRRPARILDVDGTLCDVSAVRHFVLRPRAQRDYHRFYCGSRLCPPIPQAIEYAVRTHEMGMVPVVVTARRERWAQLTRAWLDEHMPVPYDGPLHRPDDDHRPDRQVKADLLRYLQRHYDIRGAIDDSPGVVELWRSHGIPVEVVPGWVGYDAPSGAAA